MVKACQDELIRYIGLYGNVCRMPEVTATQSGSKAVLAPVDAVPSFARRRGAGAPPRDPSDPLYPSHSAQDVLTPPSLELLSQGSAFESA